MDGRGWSASRGQEMALERHLFRLHRREGGGHAVARGGGGDQGGAGSGRRALAQEITPTVGLVLHC